jgi:glycerophosphoryl diester phosphodiesterase
MPRSTLPAVIGHRCARAVAPENTVAGLRQAAALGVGWVEVDVRLSADGVPVLLHDPTLQRTTDGRGALARTRLEAVRRLDAGSGFDAAFAGEPVPTLAEFLTAALTLGIGVNLELKGHPGDPLALTRAVLAVAQPLWQPGGLGFGRPPPLLSSFDLPCLEAAAQLAPDWPRGVLLDLIDRDWPAWADGLDATAIIVNHQRLSSPDLVAELGDGGRAVLVYTVNDPQRARRLRAWGVAAVISDRPDRAMSDAAGADPSTTIRFGQKNFIYGSMVTSCGDAGTDCCPGADRGHDRSPVKMIGRVP